MRIYFSANCDGVINVESEYNTLLLRLLHLFSPYYPFFYLSLPFFVKSFFVDHGFFKDFAAIFSCCWIDVVRNL